MSALRVMLLFGAVALVGCQAATPADDRGGHPNACYNPEMTTWTFAWSPIPEAVNYNFRLDVWTNSDWKFAAYGRTKDGETTWESNTCAGDYKRVRYRVQAIFADDSVGRWSGWTELRRS